MQLKLLEENAEENLQDISMQDDFLSQGDFPNTGTKAKSENKTAATGKPIKSEGTDQQREETPNRTGKKVLAI